MVQFDAASFTMLGLFPLSSPSMRHRGGVLVRRRALLALRRRNTSGRCWWAARSTALMGSSKGGMVYAYVQAQNVRGLDMDRSDDDPLYPTGPPRVVR